MRKVKNNTASGPLKLAFKFFAVGVLINFIFPFVTSSMVLMITLAVGAGIAFVGFAVNIAKSIYIVVKRSDDIHQNKYKSKNNLKSKIQFRNEKKKGLLSKKPARFTKKVKKTNSKSKSPKR